MNTIFKKLGIDEIPLSAKTKVVYEKELENILSFEDSIIIIENVLDRYDEILEDAFDKNEFIDISGAKECKLKSLALIAICREDPFANHIPFILAAIKYFLNQVDGFSDFKNINGFDDDQEVLNAVINHFNLAKSVEDRIQKIKEKEPNE